MKLIFIVMTHIWIVNGNDKGKKHFLIINDVDNFMSTNDKFGRGVIEQELKCNRGI